MNWLRGLTGTGDSADGDNVARIIQEHGNGVESLDPEQREMLVNILSFGELQVDDVMVPRTDIVAVPADADLDLVLKAFREARHSRLPVYRETLDDISGFVHIKDIVDFWGDGDEFAIESVVHEAVVVPPSMPVLDLLARMRATRIHMAVVVDEFGGTDGLVTIEDVVEEIVGDIADEHDEDGGPLIVERDDGSIDADGRAEVQELESLLEVDLLPDDLDEEIDTLGGLVFTLLGRVPRRGEKIPHESCDLEFEITDVDPRRIKRLTIRAVDRGRHRSEISGE